MSPARKLSLPARYKLGATPLNCTERFLLTRQAQRCLCLCGNLVPYRGIEPRIVRVRSGCIASNACRANLVLRRRFERRVSPLPRDCIAVYACRAYWQTVPVLPRSELVESQRASLEAERFKSGESCGCRARLPRLRIWWPRRKPNDSNLVQRRGVEPREPVKASGLQSAHAPYVYSSGKKID